MRVALHSASPVAQTPVNRRKPPVTPVDDPLERQADHLSPSVHRALASPGEPLDAATRAYFEPRFGRDFSSVRLHTDAFAASTTRALDASAYAVGQHIVLGNETSPLLNPGSLPTLAHELTHVVQQSGGGEMHRPRTGRAQEAEAGSVANAMAAGGKPAPIRQYSAVGLACQPRRNDEEDEIERKRREAISSLDWMADLPLFDPSQGAGETETDRKRREAISSLDWMAGIPPIVFDDDAPTLIRWAERKTQEYYDPEASAEKRAAIASGLLKVFKSLRELEGRAERDSDGALIYTNRLTEKSTPWTENRVRALDEIPLFGSDSIAEWTLAAKPGKPGAKAGKGRRVSEPPKRQQAAAPARPSGLAMNITFHKRSGMTLSSEEGQRRIIAFIIASTRTGFTADQLDWVVAQIGLEKRWAPPPGMDLGAWQASFDSIPEGDEVTLTITESFTLELDRLLSEVPSQRDFLIEAYRQGVLEAEAGLKLGIATFAIGTAALGGGALLGTALAPAGAIGSGGLLGGGIGMSARTVGTHLYLNAPALYGKALLYGGATLSGLSLGQHVLEIRQRGLGWSDIPQFAGDLMPFASGYADYRYFSGGGTTPRNDKPPADSPDTEIGPPRPPVDTAEPDLVITRPARLDPESGKVKTSIVDLGSKRTFDGEVDPQTGNGQIVDRRSREVVGVISNGDIRKPSTGLPPPGAPAAPSAAPPAVAQPMTPIPSGQSGAPPAVAKPTTPIPSSQSGTPPAVAQPTTLIRAGQGGTPAGPVPGVSTPPADWRDFLPMARWAQALSSQKHGAPPNMVGMATPGPPPFTFATNEAWIYDGLPIRVVNTPTGPRAFYRRDGRGGVRPYGAQVGDWAPFLGFRPLLYGAQLVKPPSAVSPNTPPELYRWGNQEAVDADRWLKAQPQVPEIDVGVDWGIIQRRLEELGVFVEFPIGNMADVD
jgi:hypothetical protein